MIDFNNFSTTGHRDEHSTKHVLVQTVLLQPEYVSTLPGKTKNSTKAADRLCGALHAVKPIASDFRRKSFNVRFFLLTENLLHGFYHKFIFKINMGNFNM